MADKKAPDKKPAAAKGPAKKAGPGKMRGSLYEKSGDKLTPKNRHCPKCGPGFWMGGHKDRVVCGKCGYVEMQAKK